VDLRMATKCIAVQRCCNVQSRQMIQVPLFGPTWPDWSANRLMEAPTAGDAPQLALTGVIEPQTRTGTRSFTVCEL
jgi:hypothetical protein